jgi:hypothetical protein
VCDWGGWLWSDFDVGILGDWLWNCGYGGATEAERAHLPHPLSGAYSAVMSEYAILTMCKRWPNKNKTCQLKKMSTKQSKHKSAQLSLDKINLNLSL